MTFHAYIANIEKKTGKTIQELTSLAHQNGLAGEALKASNLVAWLKQEFGLGHGHAMAVYAVLKSEHRGGGCGAK